MFPSITRLFVAAVIVITLHTLPASDAHAHAQGVGLGVAVGAAYSPTTLDQGTGTEIDVGTSLAWGFFVDIPIIETLYISPAAMLYELDLGNGPKPVTDIDLNVKFMVPLGRLSIAAGGTAGLTIAQEQYGTHVGLLGYAGLNVVSNIDLFAMLQYKRLMHDVKNIDDIHVFVGGMFRF